ncbi:NEDD4 family-interacting protein 2-like [Antechinus flavipes]|uniref:NEDD4 family-interacting protein 2-like n=1 Tax=Antechinus flavipes TaxID=38775 RepID=UPI002236529C|nr:NEDD4 family-interacting protein 2-like [Antechinus flavipes]
MELRPTVSNGYQVLRNEENDPESPALEQPSTSTQITPRPTPTPTPSPSAPALSFSKWSPSPPPYGLGSPEVETASETEDLCEPFPVPPPYSVATSLPTYDEAERAKAAALAASAVASGEPTQREDDFAPRDDSTASSDSDQLRVGNDGIFLVAFFMAFIFNWVGFCLSFCTTNSIAGRYGALCGFGLSLTKWILIVRFSDYFTGYFNGQYWLWWIFLLIGLLLFFRGFYCYLKVRNMSERLATASRTRFIFSN